MQSGDEKRWERLWRSNRRLRDGWQRANGRLVAAATAWCNGCAEVDLCRVGDGWEAIGGEMVRSRVRAALVAGMGKDRAEMDAQMAELVRGRAGARGSA